MHSQQTLSPIFLCPVCQEHHNQLYPVAKCSHSFCLHCSVGYISSQANNFAAARCLQQGCRALLDKSLPVYTHLDRQTVHKLEEFETYIFLQKHPDHTSCKSKDCSGIFLIKTGACPICKARHCKKCLNLFHQGKCKQTEEEKAMKKLKFQKCPCCRAWVEKVQGCSYISCKCGIDFCYICGSQFSKDPCRKRKLWEKEIQIRKLLRDLPNIFTCSPQSLLLLIPRLIILLLIVIPFTIIICILPTIVIFALFLLFVSLILPIGLCQPISQLESPSCRRFCTFLLILCYPMLVGLSGLTFILAMFFYPCLRTANHHGIYDGIDNAIANITICYLKTIDILIGCLICS